MRPLHIWNSPPIQRPHNILGKLPSIKRHSISHGGLPVPGPQRCVPGSSVAPSRLLCDLGEAQYEPIIVKEDNLACLSFIADVMTKPRGP